MTDEVADQTSDEPRHKPVGRKPGSKHLERCSRDGELWPCTVEQLRAELAAVRAEVDYLQHYPQIIDNLEAQLSQLAAERDAAHAELDERVAEMADMFPKTWQGLITFIDEIYPLDIFIQQPDGPGDDGPRILSLIRYLDDARRAVATASATARREIAEWLDSGELYGELIVGGRRPQDITYDAAVAETLEAVAARLRAVGVSDAAPSEPEEKPCYCDVIQPYFGQRVAHSHVSVAVPNEPPTCVHGHAGRHTYDEDMEDQVAKRVCEGPVAAPNPEDKR